MRIIRKLSLTQIIYSVQFYGNIMFPERSR